MLNHFSLTISLKQDHSLITPVRLSTVMIFLWSNSYYSISFQDVMCSERGHPFRKSRSLLTLKLFMNLSPLEGRFPHQNGMVKTSYVESKFFIIYIAALR